MHVDKKKGGVGENEEVAGRKWDYQKGIQNETKAESMQESKPENRPSFISQNTILALFC